MCAQQYNPTNALEDSPRHLIDADIFIHTKQAELQRIYMSVMIDEKDSFYEEAERLDFFMAQMKLPDISRLGNVLENMHSRMADFGISLLPIELLNFDQPYLQKQKDVLTQKYENLLASYKNSMQLLGKARTFWDELEQLDEGDHYSAAYENVSTTFFLADCLSKQLKTLSHEITQATNTLPNRLH